MSGLNPFVFAYAMPLNQNIPPGQALTVGRGVLTRFALVDSGVCDERAHTGATDPDPPG